MRKKKLKLGINTVRYYLKFEICKKNNIKFRL